MQFELAFRTQAEADLIDIRDYYNKISLAVTNSFFKEFFDTINYIKQEPQLFQERYREIRIAPLYRFPYGIHYIMKNNRVIVLRVLHTKRYFK